MNKLLDKQGQIMNTPNFLGKTTQDTFNQLFGDMRFPLPTQSNLYAYQTDFGITLGRDDLSSQIEGVQILTDINVDSLTIKVIINIEDNDNSVTVYFNHEFIAGFCPSTPLKALLDARTFVLSFCENPPQVKAIETVLYGSVGDCLFGDVSSSSLIQQALVKMMVDNSINGSY
jgi:hypothetical protein